MLVPTKNWLEAAIQVIAGFTPNPAPPPAATILLQATGQGADSVLATAYPCQVGGPLLLQPSSHDLMTFNNAFVNPVPMPLTPGADYRNLSGHANGSATWQIKAPASGTADASGNFNFNSADGTTWQAGIYTPTGIGIDGQVGLFDTSGAFAGGITETINANDTFILTVQVNGDTVSFAINGAAQTPLVVVNRPNKSNEGWGITLFADDSGSAVSSFTVSDSV